VYATVSPNISFRFDFFSLRVSVCNYDFLLILFTAFFYLFLFEPFFSSIFWFLCFRESLLRHVSSPLFSVRTFVTRAEHPSFGARASFCRIDFYFLIFPFFFFFFLFFLCLSLLFMEAKFLSPLIFSLRRFLDSRDTPSFNSLLPSFSFFTVSFYFIFF